MRALVVFHGDSDHPLGRLLHKDFRHCFVCVDDGLYWILVDGKMGIPEIRVAANAEFDLAAWYRERNCTVLETQSRNRTVPPLMLMSCVAVCKAVLGIRAPFVITPKQLHDYLWRN